jgi:ATP-dependent RNA helicase DeaD
MIDNFHDLGLRQELLRAIVESGYEQPTPIQAQAIPTLLEGHDVLGQAQTGTGKTAAFALPMLNNLDFSAPGVQALVLTPTRELAAQVCTTIYKYGKFLGVQVLPIYGGTSYDRQMRRLEKGAHIVVGTPGRTLDLINRKALDLSNVRYLVLDEADEMLKMGFIEDVQAIMSEIPMEQRQTALFSATLADEIRRLSKQYMRNPVAITIAKEKLTVPLTEQRYYLVHADSKLAALSRLLETEDIQSALIFTRTRTGSAELAEALLERGYIADALHGELNQAAREAVLRRFRNGQLPLLVATDVVARGVDISGVSHVFNYDMPYDPEDYVHRIGRTGRAGRSGIAIMLVTPQERRRLYALEDFTKQKVPRMELPTPEAVRERRERRFVDQLNQVMDGGELQAEVALIETLVNEGYNPVDIAVAAVRMARAEEQHRPIEDLKPLRDREDAARRDRDNRRPMGTRGFGSGGASRDGRERGDRNGKYEKSASGNSRRPEIRTGKESDMVRLVLDQGHNQGIRPRDIVGAIASEAGIPGKAIGAIDIQNDQTYVDVNSAHVDQVLNQMRRWRLRGKQIKLTRADRSA